MEFDRLKHPAKENLDRAESLAVEVMVSVRERGVRFLDTELHDGVVFKHNAERALAVHRKLAVTYRANENGWEVALELAFDDGTAYNERAAYIRIVWMEGESYIRVSTEEKNDPIPKRMLPLLSRIGIAEKGTTVLLPHERDHAVVACAEDYRMALLAKGR